MVRAGTLPSRSQSAVRWSGAPTRGVTTTQAHADSLKTLSTAGCPGRPGAGVLVIGLVNNDVAGTVFVLSGGAIEIKSAARFGEKKIGKGDDLDVFRNPDGIRCFRNTN